MRAVIWTIAAALILLSAAATAMYTGSKMIFASFCACYIGVAFLVVPRPRLYAFTFLAFFVVLGFWLKAVAHWVWQIQFVEPVGAFGYGPEEWDAALALATAGAAGVVLARALQLWVARRGGSPAQSDESGIRIPGWYIEWRRPLWIVTLALVVLVDGVNLVFSFYQVGVNPRLVLPLHLNVPMAWLVNIGFALWIACLAWWEWRSGKGFAGGFLAAMLEAFVAAVSAHSRSFFLLHAGPYWLVGAERWSSLRSSFPRKTMLALGLCFALVLVLSLVTISLLRFQQYFDMPKLPPDYTEGRYIREVMERQLGRLVVLRWVGLEGAFIASSTPGRGRSLFIAAVTDRPAKGADALFQKAAGVPYASHDSRYVFLTNAGPIALLGFSGSALLTLIGMLGLTILAIGVEQFAARLTENPFFVAVAGAGLANVLSQMTFPYLAAVFLLQLLAAIGCVAWLQRLK